MDAPGAGLPSSRFTPCPHCGLKVNASKLDRHVERNHPEALSAEARALQAERDAQRAAERTERRAAEVAHRKAREDIDADDFPSVEAAARAVRGELEELVRAGPGPEAAARPAHLDLDFYEVIDLFPAEAFDELAAFCDMDRPEELENAFRNRMARDEADLLGLEAYARKSWSKATADLFEEGRTAAAALAALPRSPAEAGGSRAARLDGLLATEWLAELFLAGDGAEADRGIPEDAVEGMRREWRMNRRTLQRIVSSAEVSPGLASLARARLALMEEAEAALDAGGPAAARGALARALAAIGHPPDEAGLEGILRTSPHDPPAACALAWLKAKRGEVAAAREIMARASEGAFLADYFALEECALIAYAGDPRGAIETARSSLDRASARPLHWVPAVERRLALRGIAASGEAGEARADAEEAVRLARDLVALELPDAPAALAEHNAREPSARAAADRLAALGPAAVGVLTDLVLFDLSWCQVYALPALARSAGVEAAPLLIDLCVAGEDFAAEEAMKALASLGDAALPAAAARARAEIAAPPAPPFLLGAIEAIGTPAAQAFLAEALETAVKRREADLVDLLAMELQGFPDARLLPVLRRARSVAPGSTEVLAAIEMLEAHRPRWPEPGACAVCGKEGDVAVLRGGDRVCRKCWGDGAGM